MKKIALINQRYGLEVNGGSEYYTRLIAEHLKGKFEVEILTTKAIDYVTWENYYQSDVEIINGVTVRRFPVKKIRDMKQFGQINGELLAKAERTEADEKRWVDEQGPFCPELISYIEKNCEAYDLFVFVTYLYFTTSMGMRSVYDKAVLIPTAHDEPYIYFHVFRDIFKKAKGIIYLTDEEKKFVENLFHNEKIPNVVTAVGIDMPTSNKNDGFISNKNLGHYMVYVGRIDEAKGCSQLFEYFLKYKKRCNTDLKLVLMGKNAIPIPEHEDIVYLGFVTEEEKFDGIRKADLLVLPSQYESLSISVLEALQVETPVLVNGRCEVLKGHCLKSNAGLYYSDYYEFENCVNYMLLHEDARRIMGENGKRYVDTYYRWDTVTETLEKLFLQAMC